MGDSPIMVQCLLIDKVSEIIKKYRIKSQDNEPTKKFVFNAKELNPSLTARAAGLNNNCSIFIVETKHIKGA